MTSFRDGPASPYFKPIQFEGNLTPGTLGNSGISKDMLAACEDAHRGPCVGWGIPFNIHHFIVLKDQPYSIEFEPIMAQWLVFLHTSDHRPLDIAQSGFISPMRGEGQLAEHAGDYVILYEDGNESRFQILRRHQIGSYRPRWGERCFQAVSHHKPFPISAAWHHSQYGWGRLQTKVMKDEAGKWVNWICAWANPCPDKSIVGIRFEPRSGAVLCSAISAGTAHSFPLRWRGRRKVVLTLPPGKPFDPEMDKDGLFHQIQLDLGQVISAVPRLIYPNHDWFETYNNQIPHLSDRDVLIEYTSHEDACFHLDSGEILPVSEVEGNRHQKKIHPVKSATQQVKLKVIESKSGKSVSAKLHVHGEDGEYLSPTDRQRIINQGFLEDCGADFIHLDTHSCTYIPGETIIKLPLGTIYIEVSKGFEIRPIREVVEVTPEAREIVIEIEKVLPWRERGWVTADTHVHYISPTTARFEGSAEGVNIVNLLATQWGEFMTNVGDFDGETTFGSREAGGDGEYLVRVGSENRQNVLGHISLLGYTGRLITPMTTGGPYESALGDPIEVILTEWARQCRKQGGLVVAPHFPDPRAEIAASILCEDIDAIEMTSLNDLYGGINPYSLSDWYRFLNCGYLVAAVGGTDKMSAHTPIGAVRTYARINPEEPFTYQAWMEAVRRRETFATYGPLLEFHVDGHPMGSHLKMPPKGGTVDVTWHVASVTVPMSRVELVVNGEIRESVSVDPLQDQGHWSMKVDKSKWLALLVRGHYADKPEIIAAHSSPVMLSVEGSELLVAADAVTILEQIEGSMAYLDTLGTRADEITYKRMRLILESAHRSLHNRMHQLGYYHDHIPITTHPHHE
jgi:hypothetical protein